jgi:hypothetical protein
MRLSFAFVLALAACNTDGVPVPGDGGVGDQSVPVCPQGSGGSVPVLTLEAGAPAACPCGFPQDRTACTAATTCSYVYPKGTHPSGCGAYCIATDGGALTWNVPGCI